MRKAFFILSLYWFFSNILHVSAQSQGFGIPEVENFTRKEYGGATQNWKISQSKYDLMYFANNAGLLEFDGAHWNIYKETGNNPLRSVKSIGDKIYVGTYNELGYYKFDNNSQLKYTSLTREETKNLGEFWKIIEWNGSVIFHSDKALCIFKNDELELKIEAPSRYISSFRANDLLLVQDEVEGLLEVRGKRAYQVPGGDVFKGKIISTILSLSDDEIIIGTKSNGLYLWNLQKLAKWDVPSVDLLQKLNLFCGMNYADDYLVFGTILGGIVITDKQGQVVMAIDKNKGLRNNTILSLFKDSEGNIWGGTDNGIIKVDFNTNITFLQGYYNLGTGYVIDKFKRHYYLGTNQGLYKIKNADFHNPLKDASDFYFIPEASGQVWNLYADDEYLLCGHNEGVIQITEDKAELITPLGVNGAWVFKEIKSKPNLLLVGTYDGLIVLEKKSKGWKFRNKVEGLSESSRFLEWDKLGNLWMSHGDIGAYRIKLSEDFSETLQVDTFKLSAFPGNEEQSPLVLSKVKDECIFVGSSGIFNIDQETPKRLNILDAFFEENQFPNKLLEDRFGNIWYFFDSEMGVLRLQEDGSYTDVQSPFSSLVGRQVGGFEHVFQLDEKNTFIGIEDGFAHYLVKDDSNFRNSFNVHIRSFKSLNDSIEYSKYQEQGTLNTDEQIVEFSFKDNSFDIKFAATYYEDRETKYSTFLENYDEKPLPFIASTSRQLTKIPEGQYVFVVRAKNGHGIISDPISYSFVVKPPWYRSAYAKWSYILLMIVLIYSLSMIINKRIEMNQQKEKKKQQELFRQKEELHKREALANEKEMIRLRNDKLRSSIKYKEKELANSTMNIIQKNEFLSRLKMQLKKFLESGDREALTRKIKSLIKEIDKDIDSKSYWEVFEVHLEQVHADFLARLKEKHPELSGREQKLCAYIKMGMSSKEIATLMNISFRAVENNRYHLRQKLDIEKGDNLATYIESI